VIPNLYDVLDVDISADAATIKKAFYRLAQEHHPDHDGDADKFERIHFAYKVLMDPERRAQYDQTGNAGTTDPDNTDAKILAMVDWAFDNAMGQVLDKCAEPIRQDMILIMCQALSGRLQHCDSQVPLLEGTRDVLAKLLGRFTVVEGKPNILENILASKINDLNQGIARIDTEKKTFIPRSTFSPITASKNRDMWPLHWRS